MKILVDHNVPKKLRDAFTDHVVKTAKEMDWTQLKNGDLLREAEQAGFTLMLTCDQNLAYQQNLSDRKIALLIFNTNNWQILQRNVRLITLAIDTAEPGSFRFLEVKSR